MVFFYGASGVCSRDGCVFVRDIIGIVGLVDVLYVWSLLKGCQEDIDRTVVELS